MHRTRAAEQRLGDAIEALSEGFALFGSNGRLITVNARFYELTGHDPAKIRPGSHNDEILASIAAIGHDNDREDEAADYAAGRRADFENKSGPIGRRAWRAGGGKSV